MGFLYWLTTMGFMFFGWLLIPIGIDYIKNGSVFIGILMCLSAIPIEIVLYRLSTYFEGKEQEKERAYRQERENKIRERLNASPVKDLTPLEFEAFTKYYLQDRNYTKVKLTKQSGDFGADVLAVAPDNTKICVQCKKYSKPVGVKAVQEIHSAKSYYKCDRAAVAVTSAGFTKQAIKLSEEISVYLFAFDDYYHQFQPVNSDARFFLEYIHKKSE